MQPQISASWWAWGNGCSSGSLTSLTARSVISACPLMPEAKARPLRKTTARTIKMIFFMWYAFSLSLFLFCTASAACPAEQQVHSLHHVVNADRVMGFLADQEMPVAERPPDVGLGDRGAEQADEGSADPGG